MVCKLCRLHGRLTKAAKGMHITPAMAAGLADHVWKIEELVELSNPDG